MTPLRTFSFQWPRVTSGNSRVENSEGPLLSTVLRMLNNFLVYLEMKNWGIVLGSFGRSMDWTYLVLYREK